MRRGAFWLPLCFLALAARPAAASDIADFARCISRAGATFYTASWCPHCAQQIRMFGNAIGYVRVIDCTVGCPGVRSFPTWTFGNGSRLSGVASFEDLGSRTGCRFGPRRERPDDGGAIRETTSGGWRERYVAGAKIIEVPRR